MVKFVRPFYTILLLLLLQAALPAPAAAVSPDLRDLRQVVRIKVTGTVVDPEGAPLIGANVVEEGTPNGSSTDAGGRFIIEAPVGGVLTVSYLGYITRSVAVPASGEMLIFMEEDAQVIDNVVVTALGIRRENASLSYSVKQVGGEELTRVKDANMINGLTGKISGLQINKTSSGLGSSARVLMRGIRSVVGNNQPLYVIDGIPILNSTNEQASTAVGGTADAGNRDGGDGISNLNPEDVESISVLKGASAAALYGSQAANGVILITTKKGSTDVRKISFSSNLTTDRAVCLPRFQNNYGVSDGAYSWGERNDNMPVYNNAGKFFQTGVTAINNLSISAGNERYQTYFSYANTTARGLIENNRLEKHNINFRETASLFDGKLKLDGSATLFRQQVNNRTPPGGFYMNPLVGLFRFPRGEDISYYRENFEVWDESRNLNVQNWHSDIQDFEQNPWWVTNRIRSKDTRTRAMASLSAELTLTSWLKLKARGSADYLNDKVRQQFYASTAPALAGANGRYIEMGFDETLLYGDVLALAEKKWTNFSLNVTLGGSINDKTLNSLRYDSKTASLYYANVFNVANINMNGSAYISQQIDARRQMQSVFGTAQVGYREALYFDVSARNDWSSTLAYTPHEGSGFFYPSFGASWIITKTLALPEWVSFGKLRAAWSRVGNDIPLFITNPAAHISAGGGIEPVDSAPFEDMKPEMTTSIELGTEWKFVDNRINFSLTWYRTNTRNQFFQLPAQTGDIYAYRYVNAGDIQNTGLEATLSGYPISNHDMTWRTEFNFSRNRNKVVKLHEELPVFVYGPAGFSSSYAMKLREGGSFGDIYGKAFRRDESGNILYETAGEMAGQPLVEGEGNLIKVGNVNPLYSLSWGNNFSYKQWSFSFLVDSRYGGSVLSQTLADMDLYGVTRATGDARDRGYVMLEGTRINNVETFYRNVVGGRAGVTEYYMYSATNVRMREMALTFTFPKRWIERTKVLQNVHLSLVGRNLFFIYKEAPFDPELVLSTGSDNQGIEVYGMPTTRSLGFNLKFDF